MHIFQSKFECWFPSYTRTTSLEFSISQHVLYVTVFYSDFLKITIKDESLHFNFASNGRSCEVWIGLKNKTILFLLTRWVYYYFYYYHQDIHRWIQILLLFPSIFNLCLQSLGCWDVFGNFYREALECSCVTLSGLTVGCYGNEINRFLQEILG